MKKRIISACLMICTLIAIVPYNAFAASNVSKKNAAYSAYYDFLQERVDSIGIIQPSEVRTMDGFPFPEKNGAYYARLIDLDGDGIKEFFYIESHSESLYWYLYTYKNNYMQMLASNDTYTAAGSVVKQNLGIGYYGFTTDKNGKTYFYVTGEDLISGKYYTLKNGTLSKQELNVGWLYNWSASGTVNGQHVYVHSDGRHSSGYQIDGKKVNYNTFNTRKNFLRAKNVEEYACYEGKRVPDGSVQKVLKELEANVPAGYISGYRTPSEWAKTTVEQSIAEGLVPAYLQKKYNQPITRAEFCALATAFYENLTGTPITDRKTFTDTKDINVEKMAAVGVVNGVAENRFSPKETLTREMAAVILANLAAALDTPLPAAEATFSDNSSISSWALTQVGRVQYSNIMNGVENNCFAPKVAYTREQSIVTLSRLGNAFTQVESIILPSTFELVVGRTEKAPEAKVLPENTVNKNLTWKSSDSSICSIDVKNGTLTGVSEGTATITVKAANGITVTCQVTVRPMTTVKLPITVNYLADVDSSSIYGERDINYVPNRQFVRGEVTIHRVTTKTFNTFEVLATVTDYGDSDNGELWGDTEFSPYSKRYGNGMPYLKWIVKDMTGNIVDSGFEWLLVGEAKFEIQAKNMIEGQEYILEFLSDQGKTKAEVIANMPTIVLPELPVTEKLYRGTVAVESATVAIKYNWSDDTYRPVISLKGTQTFYDHKCDVKLVDASGDVLESRSVSFYKDTSQTVSFWLKGAELKGGETYYIKLEMPIV